MAVSDVATLSPFSSTSRLHISNQELGRECSKEATHSVSRQFTVAFGLHHPRAIYKCSSLYRKKHTSNTNTCIISGDRSAAHIMNSAWAVRAGSLQPAIGKLPAKDEVLQVITSTVSVYVIIKVFVFKSVEIVNRWGPNLLLSEYLLCLLETCPYILTTHDADSQTFSWELILQTKLT